MINFSFKLIFVLLFLQSCTSSEGKTRKTPIELVVVFEAPKNTSLFHNQKHKLFQISPKDERRKDSKIDALLKTIEKAIKQKDLNLLFSVMDEDVISSYGGGVVGFKGIKEVWGGDYQELWDKLSKILALGGTVSSDSSYSIPYDGEIDEKATRFDDMMVPHGCGITTCSNSKIYPNIKLIADEAIIVGRVHMLVDLESSYSDRTHKCMKVNILGTGIHGFVKQKDFYCSSDYSLHISKNKQGIWKIAAFAPWD